MPMPSREQIQDALRKRHRPRAAQGHRRRSAWSARSSSPRTAASTWSSRSPRPAARSARTSRRPSWRAVSALEASPTVNVGFDVLSTREKQGLAQRLGRQGGLPEGALAAGQERHLRRLRARAASASPPSPPTSPPRSHAEGKRRPRSTPTSGATRSRACSACTAARWCRAERKILPLEAARRREGDLDRVLPRRAGPGDHLARADAAQGDPPVPRGRRLGRARLPADRPAARHRRRLDDARPAAAAGASS